MPSTLSNITHIFGWFSFFTAIWSTITLFVLIEKRSPEAFGGYKNFLRIYCFYALGFSIVDWLAQPGVLIDIYGFGYIFYAENRLLDLGYIGGLLLQILYCGCFIASSSFLSLNFIYRYVSSCKTYYLIYFRGWRVFLMFLYCFVPFAIWSWLVYTVMSPTPEKTVHLNHTTMLFENFNLHGKPYIAVINRQVSNSSDHKFGDIEWNAVVSLMGLFAFQGFFYTVSLICGILTYRETMTLLKLAQMSKELYKMQMQLLRAIVIQASVPLVLVYIPPAIMIIGGMAGVYVGQIGYYVAMSISMYPPLDALVFLLSIRCYRSYLFCESETSRTSGGSSAVAQATAKVSAIENAPA